MQYLHIAFYGDKDLGRGGHASDPVTQMSKVMGALYYVT